MVGITINEYQVQRATYHNEKQGLVEQCRAVRGNFLDMPFEAATFDGAYAMEATCHAPTLEQASGAGRARGGAAGRAWHGLALARWDGAGLARHSPRVTHPCARPPHPPPFTHPPTTTGVWRGVPCA